MLGCNRTASLTGWRPRLLPAIWHRDLATGTQLTQYKGNNSNPKCFCMLGSDYFAAAQASKDAVHIYALHKVRRTSRRRRRRRGRRGRCPRCTRARPLPRPALRRNAS
jgi:hypothetical protein